MARQSTGKPTATAVRRPTPAELEILKVLWRRGPSTVREVHDEFVKSAPVVYTTVLKTMQIMREKGLLRRDETGRRHLYSPVVEAERTRVALIDDFIDRVFGGSAVELVLGTLARKPASASELAEIRRLLDKK